MTFETALSDLLDHMEWADALVWTAVLASPIAASDTWLRERLYHVHSTQAGFLEVWTGDDARSQPELFANTAAMVRWARQQSEYVRAEATALTASDLAEDVPAILVQASVAGLGPGTGMPSLGDTVLQVIAHGHYHRGQINLHLRELEIEPPLTEYFAWVWRGKPRANWPTPTSE